MFIGKGFCFEVRPQLQQALLCVNFPVNSVWFRFPVFQDSHELTCTGEASSSKASTVGKAQCGQCLSLEPQLTQHFRCSGLTQQATSPTKPDL